MSKQITLTYYGVSGQGETVAKAKEDAGRKITAIIKDIEPRFATYKDHVVVAGRTEYSAGYKILWGASAEFT